MWPRGVMAVKFQLRLPMSHKSAYRSKSNRKPLVDLSVIDRSLNPDVR